MHSPGKRPIALLSASLRGGGAERVIAIVANELASRGHSVDLLLVQAVGEYLSDLQPSVRVVDLRASRAAVSTHTLARYLRQCRPLSLLATQTHVNLIALAAHRMARSRARLILREANTLSVAARSSGKLTDRILPHLARWGYPRADLIIAVSMGVGKDLQATWAVPPEKIAVIYNPMITPDLRARAAEAVAHPWALDSRQPLVLGVGRLTRQKNFPLLLRALALLRQQVPARLLILGEGQERERLTALTQDLGLEDAVAMPGFVDNPFAYMSRASAFVLSSSWEGLPGVLIQALACGCPVVSTDCPSGPREILDGGRIGALVRMDDPRALSEGILRGIRNELLPAEPEWLAQFTSERIIEEYLEVLTAPAP